MAPLVPKMVRVRFQNGNCRGGFCTAAEAFPIHQGRHCRMRNQAPIRGLYRTILDLAIFSMGMIWAGLIKR